MIQKANKIFLIIFFLYIKMTNNYYQRHKERLRQEAHKRYQNLPEEKKDKRRKKASERYQNFTEEEKEKECNKNFPEEQK